MAFGWIEQKRRYRRYQARTKQLPASYRAAVESLERYLTYYGAIAKGGVLVAMLEDLLDLFEQSAAAGTPVRDVVGDDPVEFAEDFLRNYAGGQWINRERERLNAAIDRIASEQS
jgi:DNA-binding ferritin-like protein (Dps family)